MPDDSKDSLSMMYFSNPEVFADIYNYVLYSGEQVITPDSLTELDPVELVPSPKRRSGKRGKPQPRRDILKQLVCKRGGNATYVILGIEEQTNPDCGMVIRAMLYDALRYDKQRKRLSQANSEKGLFNSRETGRFFTGGILPTDKVHPVITLVVFLSDMPWEGPRCLSEFLDLQD